MNINKKTECNNEWAGPNTSLTSKDLSKEKDENNNQWTSTSKRSPDIYSENCHPEKHNNKN